MKNWLKRNYYRLANYSNGLNVGKNVVFDTRNQFEGHNIIGDDAMVVGCHLGYNTYISAHSIIKNTRIGRFCSIGRYVQTGLGRHPSGGFVSTHPSFFSTTAQAGFTFTTEDTFETHLYADGKYIVAIGNDVWIGHNVTLMDGITIGDGAIVAAGAVVTKDVAPYSIVGGLPAKFMRNRFTSEQIEQLLKIKWWDWDLEKIKAHAHLFNDIDKFIAAVGN